MLSGLPKVGISPTLSNRLMRSSVNVLMYFVGVLCSMDSRYEWKAFWSPSGLDDSRAGPIMIHYDGTHGWHFGYSMGPAPITPSRREFDLFLGKPPRYG